MEEISLADWMGERLLPLPALDEEQRYRLLKGWVEAMPASERLAFFKLITGELRVGVSRLQVVKALAEVAGVEESRMAQRMIGYAQARRAPEAQDFAALIGQVDEREGAVPSTPAAPTLFIWRSPGRGRLRGNGGDAWTTLRLDRRMEVRWHPGPT